MLWEELENNTKIFSRTKKIKTKLYCVICGKYRKTGKPKISYVLEKRLVLLIICSKCKNEDEKIFTEEKSIEILKILGLIEIYNCFKNISKEFRLFP